MTTPVHVKVGNILRYSTFIGFYWTPTLFLLFTTVHRYYLLYLFVVKAVTLLETIDNRELTKT